MGIDDAYLGGEPNRGKPGRGSENKQAFAIAVETDETPEHPTYAVIEPVRTFDNGAVADWAKRRLKPQVEVFSDGLGAFRRFAIDHAHTVLQSEGGRAATQLHGARWAHVALSTLVALQLATDGRGRSVQCHGYRTNRLSCCHATRYLFSFGWSQRP